MSIVEDPAPATACPVCWVSFGTHPVCSVCEWPLRTDYLLGAVTADEQRAFEKRMQAAQRQFDLVAAARAAGFPDAGDAELLSKLEAFVRAGPPRPGEREDALAKAESEHRAPGAEAPGSAVDFARRAASANRRATRVVIVEADADGIAVTRFAVEARGALRQIGGIEPSLWTSLLPQLPDAPHPRWLQLAGGVGHQAVAAARRLDARAMAVLPGLSDRGAHVVLVCREPGWPVPERAVQMLGESLPAADRVWQRTQRRERDPQQAPVAISAPGVITAFASAHANDEATWVAAGGRDGRVHVWEMPNPKPVARGVVQDDRVTAIDIVAGGAMIVSGAKDGSVRLWRSGTAKTRLLTRHDEQVSAIRLAGGAAFSLGNEGQLHRTAAGKAGSTASSQLLFKVGWSSSTALVVTSDGHLLAVGGNGGIVTIHDATTGKTIQVLKIGEPVTALALDPADRLLAVGCADGRARVYAIRKPAVVAEVTAPAPIRSLALTTNGSLVTGDHAGEVRLWRADGDVPAEHEELVGTHTRSVRGVSLSANGILVSAGPDGVLRVWQVGPV